MAGAGSCDRQTLREGPIEAHGAWSERRGSHRVVSSIAFKFARSAPPILQRSPDKQASIERRRRLAATGPLPPAWASRFTTGEPAVLRIIGSEVRQHGVCALYIDAIAARAGVCRITAQNALREARALGLVVVKERRRPRMPSLSNPIYIINSEWRTWLRLSVDRGGGFKRLSSTGNRTYEGRRGGGLKGPKDPQRPWKRQRFPDG
jgi:hypothetical protein